MSKLDDYISDIEFDISILQKRLDYLLNKIFKWGKESEIKLLQFIIGKKQILLQEVKDYKKELVAFKD